MDHTAESQRSLKLRAIADVFGPDVARQFGSDAPGMASGPSAPAEATSDPVALAKQKGQLIEHLRSRMERAMDMPRSASRPAAGVKVHPSPTPTLDRLRAAAPMASLAGEHPAVIAHVLRNEKQAVRVAVLRGLPGQLARQVMQRLRSSS